MFLKVGRTIFNSDHIVTVRLVGSTVEIHMIDCTGSVEQQGTEEAARTLYDRIWKAVHQPLDNSPSDQ